MKKLSLSLIVMAFSFCLFAKDVRLFEKECEYKEVQLFEGYKKQKAVLSKKEFQEDLNQFCYFLEFGYSGYNDMLSKGFDINNFKINVNNCFENNSEIESRKFIFQIEKELKNYINDYHFDVILGYDTYFLCKKEIIYWTNIYVQKNDNKYSVIESSEKTVSKGDEYTGDIKNLYLYPSKGENVYRLAKMSAEKMTEYNFEFNNKNISVTLFDDNSIAPSDNLKYKDFFTDDSAYIAINKYTLPLISDSSRKAYDILYEKYYKSGSKYIEKKNIILDLRSNMGGNPKVAIGFIYALYNNSNYKTELIKNFDIFNPREVYYSPAAVQARYLSAKSKDDKYEMKIQKKQLKEQQSKPLYYVKQALETPVKQFSGTSRFNGQLIILIDRNTCSAAEEVVYLAKKLFGKDKVSIIGENSAGCCTYVDVWVLQLPNSKIGVNLSFEKNFAFDAYDCWHGEGKGFYPDYWSLGKDLNETIFLVTEDEMMKEKLKDIENRLM